MSPALWVVVIIFGLGALLAAAVLLGLPFFGGGDSAKSQIRSMVSGQRASDVRPGAQQAGPRTNLYKVAEEARVRKTTSSKLTLEKKLKYAQWKIPPMAFRVAEVVISICAVFIIGLFCNIVLTSAAALSGPLFMRWLLNLFVERRYRKFDSDFPQFLLSLVGLIKTGMQTMGAMDASAQNLEPSSLVRQEVELMTERLRLGISEDKSIGSFGEDVFHPEIELFVQALLLSKRVGGNLSDTLDRLARQVRKRQYFRSSATAAIGMQRGSIYFIIGIMIFMEAYLYYVYPQAVVGAIKDPLGWQIYQAAFMLILLGIFWVRQITKIRI